MSPDTRYKEPDWDSLGITNDHVFFTLMKAPDIAKEILERSLSVKVKELIRVEQQKTVSVLYDAKSIRLDVYLEDDDTVYNIEMQVVENRDLRRRTRFYQSMIDVDTFEKGEFYRDLKDMIIIFICPFDVFKQGQPRYTFENICKEDTSIRLGDGVQKIFLNAKAFSKEKDPKLRNLLAFIHGEKVENDSFIDRLSTKIHKLRNTKEWRIEHMKINLREQDAFYDGHFKGELKGMLKGRAEGILEGKLEGILEGKLKGKLEGKLETARNLLDILDDATIAQKTGLPLEKIQELRREAFGLPN